MQYVAPYTGAWIEIVCKATIKFNLLVAPYTGAWIEIQIRNLIREGKLVAPFAGAWIEIILVPPCTEKYDQSLPSRERGLKYFYVGLILLEQKSLPSRERGLK